MLVGDELLDESRGRVRACPGERRPVGSAVGESRRREVPGLAREAAKPSEVMDVNQGRCDSQGPSPGREARAQPGGAQSADAYALRRDLFRIDLLCVIV